MKHLTALALLLAATTAGAGQRTDYAQEWPLRLAREDGGAFRVVLSEAMYRAAQDTALRDIEVFNAAGESVPVALLGPEAASAQEWPRETLQVPWFPLPAAAGADVASDWSVHTERDGRGRVVRVDTSIRESAAAPGREYLLDLSQIKTPLAALQLEWPDTTAAFQSRVSLTGSDDLQHWHFLSEGLVAQLRNDGRQLRRDRLELSPQRSFRYLRLAALTPDALPELSKVSAEFAPPPPEPEWRWLSLQGELQREDKQDFYAYTLDARIPAAQVDVRAQAGNSAVDWTVLSREPDRKFWSRRAGPWTGYRVAAGDSVEASTPQHLAVPLRERNWRVHAVQALNAPPELVLGYRPEVLVFLAQGAGPYSVAAGSARARRQDAPIGTLLDALRRRHGPDWKPYPALPGEGRAIAGSQSQVTEAKPWPDLDWRTVLLWTLLLGGTVFVAGLALRLLQSPPPNNSDDQG